MRPPGQQLLCDALCPAQSLQMRRLGTSLTSCSCIWLEAHLCQGQGTSLTSCSCIWLAAHLCQGQGRIREHATDGLL